MMKDVISSFAKNSAALGLGIFIALAILEVGLRVFSPFETRLRGNEIVLPTSRQYIYDGSGLRGVDRTITHTKNSLGFRGPELREEVEYRLKVIAVGGSTTECVYLSDGKDWPSLLYLQLKEDFSSVWINNAGLDGHSTIGHTVLFNDVIVNLQPDIVIFLVGANDSAVKDGVKSSAHTASHIKGKIRIVSLEGFVKSLAAYSDTASLSLNIFRYLRAKSFGLNHHNVDSIPHADINNSNLSEIHQPHIESYVPAYKQRLRALVALVRKYRTESILVTQPALYGEGTIAWSVLELYNEATRQVGEEEGVLVVDLARKLPKTLDYFYDHVHFTNSGSAEVARILYHELHEYFTEKLSSQSAETVNIPMKSELLTPRLDTSGGITG